MASNNFYEKKSPQQRFLLIIGIFFFAVYLCLGLAVIFWKDFPLNMEFKYRIALGVLLVVYALFRFYRFFKTEPTEE